MPAKFTVSKSKTGSYRFTMTAPNGQVIVTSQSYATKAAALNGIASIRKNAIGAALSDTTVPKASPAKPAVRKTAAKPAAAKASAKLAAKPAARKVAAKPMTRKAPSKPVARKVISKPTIRKAAVPSPRKPAARMAAKA